MKRGQRGEHGTALLITMVVIAVIGSLSFAVGRVALSGFTQVLRLEDSLNAYQAATSGIEDGLLRFRFDKDVQTPQGCNGSAQVPTESSPQFTRVNITTGASVNCIHPASAAIPPASDVVYDLKIWHRLDPGEAEEQQTVTSARGVVPALRRDQSIEYDVSGLQGQLEISWQFDRSTSQNALEIIPLDQDGAVVASKKRLVRGSAGSPVNISMNGVAVLRLRPFGADLATYRLDPRQSTESISSRHTVIESIGYFGRSKRRLRLVLDRQSGSILEVYDFVLFSGGGDIIGPGN